MKLWQASLTAAAIVIFIPTLISLFGYLYENHIEFLRVATTVFFCVLLWLVLTAMLVDEKYLN